MSTAEQLSFDDVEPIMDIVAIDRKATRDAVEIAEYFMAYGAGEVEQFGQRFFWFESPLHRATDSLLMSILEIEAVQIFEDPEDISKIAYKIGDSYVFRQEEYDADGTALSALYTAYMDCA